MVIQAFENMIETLTSETSHKLINYQAFLDEFETSGELILRNIFQLFHDMIHFYITESKDEFADDSESMGFLNSNLDKLFIKESEKPFFSDRLFTNRLVNLAKSFRMSSERNKIYVFRGPAGSGKSTFLNNLLNKLEKYVRSDEGLMYEVVWKIPIEDMGSEFIAKNRAAGFGAEDNFFEVPCPNHDNPILLIPRKHRESLLKDIISSSDLKKKLFKHRQYNWVLNNEPCTICGSIFDALAERFPISRIYSMIYARRYLFNRKQGIGISVFNSGDELERTMVKTNERVQQFLNEFFKDSNKVKFLFSSYANTNQGIRALMDLKAKNIQRFLDLHGIISDEVHKVGDIEERIKSLFVVLMNPGDLENVGQHSKPDEATKIDESLKDRIHEILVPYVLDYNTEIHIYVNTFGEQIKLRFMPHVLENFAKTVISSRIKKESKAIKEWLKNDRIYEKYCDPDFFLLKMELYSGRIPDWLSKEDKDSLRSEVRRNILAESENEGHQGFSGRESIQLFNDFYTKYSKKRPITMQHINEFFMDDNKELKNEIPRDFLKHLTDLYDYEVLKEVKDSMYSYNEEEISKSILNYLVAITQNVGDLLKNPYLNNEELLVTEDFLDIAETYLMGYNAHISAKRKFREDAVNEYAAVTLAKEIMGEKKHVTETKQYIEMFQQFTKTAREKVLEPYSENSNFRCAIKEFATEEFNKYDSKIKERVQSLFRNLQEKYSYSTESVKSACLYVLDNDLVKKFRYY
ncbi:MAG: serine protein kinase PrkA [Candidatus Riflebacteria bacterium]|nr:serine protein kinase PrkA [Candidatus Riflebacteria bacterium]